LKITTYDKNIFFNFQFLFSNNFISPNKIGRWH